MKWNIAALTAAAFACAAQADVIITNLPSSDSTQSAFLQDGRIKAMGFHMGNEDFQLENVIIRLDADSTAVDPLIRIYDDNGGAPGTLIDTMIDPAFVGIGPADWTFTPSASVTLSAGATYWLVVYNDGGGNIDWKAGSTTPAGPHATHVGGLFSVSSGPNPPLTGNSSILNSYEVNGSTGDCACAADLTGGCETNTNDFFAFLALYQAQDPAADFSPGGGINTNDFFAYLAAYQADLNNPDCPG